MDKITAQSYLEIIGLLTSSSAQNNTDTIKDLFCFNISKVYECLQSNLKYTELLEYINEKFPYLSSSPKLVKKITKEEVVKLFVEWNLFLLEMYSLSLTKEMRIYNRNLKKNVQYLKSPELLSFNEKKSLWYSIDFVFVLGISIHMHPGVGLPVTMKSQACQNMQKYFASSSIPFDDSNQIIPEYKDSFELFQKSLNLVMDLFQLKLSPLFKEYIISHHFNTYITALFQISFSKMAPPNKVILVAKSTLPAISPATTAAMENNENDITSRATTTTPFTVDVSRYKEYLDDIIMTSPLKFIFRELILLIGGTPPETKMEKPSYPKTPKWLLRRCSAYIRECIVKDSGIQSIILSLIDECSDVQAKVKEGRPVNVDWNKCNLVARIVTNCPLGSYSSERYYSIIAEQIIEIIKRQYYKGVCQDGLVSNRSDNSSKSQQSQLSNNINCSVGSDNINKTAQDSNKGSNCFGDGCHDDGKVGQGGAKFSNETSRAMMPCVVRILENLLQKEPKIFYECVLNVIIDPLICCTEGKSNRFEAEKCEKIVSERDMSICIETLHELTVILHFPGSTLARCLLPYLNVLFQLYLYASGGISFLRSTIESLVQHVFNQLEPGEISNYFYTLTNLNVRIPTTTTTSDDMPAYKTTSKPSATLAPSLQTFATANSGLGENRDVTNCIYRMDPLVRFVPGPTGGIQIVRSSSQQDTNEAIINLEEIETKSTCISKLIMDSDNKELAVQVFLTCLKGLTEIVADEFKTDTEFIQIFSSKFSNINLKKMSHNILLLALLGILVDKLDHLCLKNAGQIFFFSQLTMERSIKFMQHANPNVVLEVANFQEETLALVIGLLATILLGPNQLTREEWTKAGGLLPSLRYLSDHHNSPDVRLSSFELMKTIMTRGKLLDICESSGKLGRGLGGSESLKNEVKTSLVSTQSKDVKTTGHRSEATPVKRVQFVDQSCGNSVSGASFNAAASPSAASMSSFSSSSSSSSSLPPSPSLSSSSSSASSFPSHKSLTDSSSINESVSLPLPSDNDLLKPLKTTMIAKDTKVKSALMTSEAKNEKSSTDLPPLSSSCSSKTPKTVRFSNPDVGTPKEVFIMEEISEENLSFNNELQYHSEIKSLLETLKSSNRSNNSSLGKTSDTKNTDYVIGDSNDDRDDLALFQEMLVDLNDVMLPVISHGLLVMRKLIEKRSPPVEKYRNLLFKICRYNVKHEDSYVYLNAIYALSALTTMYHERFLQILMDDYVEADRGIGSFDYLKVDENQMRVIDVKLKLGEALLRVVTRLGSSAIAYKNKLFSTLVKVSRNDYPTVRSSAITNLAQLCKLLGFSLSSNVNEIFNSLKCILKYDKSVEVRRAAALATHQILQGTSKETLRILGDVLAEFYRLLKNVYYIEKDDVVKIHIQHSIEELNDIMKNFLFPTPALEKNIFILNPPPSSY